MKAGICCVGAGFDTLYAGFYVEGLRGCYKQLQWAADLPTPRYGISFITPEGRRIAIDAADDTAFHAPSLAWCHVYGKVNLWETELNSLSSDDRSKVRAIGPSFGLKFRFLPHALLCAARESRLLRHTGGFPSGDFPSLLKLRAADALRQARRPSLAAYVPGEVHANYVFFIASLWGHRRGGTECNTHRAHFIEECLARRDITFEGGFAPQRRRDVRMRYIAGFEPLTVRRRYSANTYLAKVRHSALVFNTPAVFFCHGWKLAEFLALGKAILTTPLTRLLPAPLEHGVHLHECDGSPESIRDGLDRMLRDVVYRENLERQARVYWETHLAPARVIETLTSGELRPG